MRLLGLLLLVVGVLLMSAQPPMPSLGSWLLSWLALALMAVGAFMIASRWIARYL